MIEIAAAVSMASGAFNAIKRGMDAGKDAQDMAQFFGKFFDSKDDIIKAGQYSKNQPVVNKIFTGTSVEAQAMQTTAAKHKVMQLEKDLREYLIWSGQGAFYEDMIQERRRIMNARLQQAKADAEQKKFYIDVGTISILCVVSIGLIMLMIGAVT